MRAIISVSNKTGLGEFARGLDKLDIEIFSTGGTKKILQEAGVRVRSVSDITGFPEILGGRVKTLHPMIHGGILARRSIPDHIKQLADNNIQPIDLVVVNLYPFAHTIANKGVTIEEALENIDIGGPTMVRASAKNYPDVIIVIDPVDYPAILEHLQKGDVSMEVRKKLAQKAFQHVASYDTAIAQYLRRDEEAFPQDMTIALKKHAELRYGENPHQKAALYLDNIAPNKPAISSAKILGGKELSYNNIMDADATWTVVSAFTAPTVAIVKHTNPCGLSSNTDVTEAYRRALAGDPISAFGGIVAINRPVDTDTAREISGHFYEIIIAPGYSAEALEILRQKQGLRILALNESIISGNTEAELDYRRVTGGFLIQTTDISVENEKSLHVVTKRAPTVNEIEDLLFTWKIVKYVKSNAIVLAKDNTMMGMGAGQPNRVTSVHLALRVAGNKSRGSVLGSDAFFPFPDGIELAASGGVTAIIQPGGSIRDAEVIKACDKNNMAMVFTGVRHFRH